jgi:hypothetical protein
METHSVRWHNQGTLSTIMRLVLLMAMSNVNYVQLWNLSETDQPVQILLNDHFGGVHRMALLPIIRLSDPVWQILRVDAPCLMVGNGDHVPLPESIRSDVLVQLTSLAGSSIRVHEGPVISGRPSQTEV